MLTGRSIAVALATLLAMISPTRADFVLQFASTAGLEVTQYPTIEVGQTFDVYVYLLQSSGTLARDEGLFSAGFRLSYGSGTVAARVLAVNDVQPNGLFQNVFSQITLDSGGVNLDLVNPNPQPGQFGPITDPNRLLLARLRFTGVSEGAMQLRFQDLDSNSDQFTTLGSDLDSSVNFSRTANLNVVATPEPGSIMLLVLGTGVLVPSVYRRVCHRLAAVATDEMVPRVTVREYD